jgi:hypothetical protein
MKGIFYGAANITIHYKTDIKVLILSFIFYIQQNISICKEHLQVVFEYISIFTELPFKMDQLLYKKNTCEKMP